MPGLLRHPVDFLSQLSLLATTETESIREPDQETERITLSTIHQAKGLEWRAVFVIWLTDGMFPSSRSLESVDSMEEERRLFYVAVTRAKDELYLTYPAYWPGGSGDNRLQRPSRFLKEIPHDLFEEWQVGVRRTALRISNADSTDYPRRSFGQKHGHAPPFAL